MSRKVYNVSHRPDGQWQVKARGNERASVVAPTKDKAVEAGRELAHSAPLSQLVIRKADGQIQTEHTYGNDPYPPKG
jgi:hypothetical protein